MKESNHTYEAICSKIELDTILFFDMDGTLVNTDMANYLSYKKAIQLVTQTNFDIPFNNHRFTRSSIKSILPNLTPIEYNEIIMHKNISYQDYLSQTTLNSLVAEILIKYSRTNQTVLVTNCREDRALMTLDYHRIGDKFNNYFFRKENINNEKINKFRNAISCLNISPKLVVAFENEEAEIEDALIAGISKLNIINYLN